MAFQLLYIYIYIFIYIYIYIYISIYIYIYVTGPAKRDQVGTMYIISRNRTYLEFCVQYLLSVSCKMLPMNLFIYGKNVTYVALADH